MKFEGWALTYWAAAIVILMSAPILFSLGWNDASFHVAIRATARTSFGLFFFAFTASSLYRLLPFKFTRWLLRNRRYIGVSFAVSHFVHLSLIATIALVFLSEQNAAQVIFGFPAYCFIMAMALTSSDRAQAWLGLDRWRLLHLVGGYYILLVFSLSFIIHALVEPVFYTPFIIAVIGILGLRAASRRQLRRQTIEK
jgi:sulfoxide reductase heme-binding subunit YedZ